MPVGTPDDEVARRFVGMYRRAENALLNQLARAIATGAETDELYEQAAEAARLRREAEQVLASVEAQLADEADRAHERSKRKARRQADREIAFANRLVGDDEDPPPFTPPDTLGARGRFALPSGANGDRLYTSRVHRGPIDQLARSLSDRMTPVHRAVTRTVDDAYKQIIARASSESALGTITRREAAQNALNEFARRGISGFTDAAGRRWDLTTYTEMAVRSSTARSAVMAGVERMRSAGIDLVFVSGHTGACDLCGPWEGRVLFAGGSSGPQTVQVQSSVSDELVTVDVAGSLDVAMEAGLLHPNCRHSISAYLPGATSPPALPGTDRGTEYGHTQKLRYLERRVRAAKRVEAVAMSPDAARDARRRVRAAQARIRDHVGQTGVPRQRTREQITAAR